MPRRLCVMAGSSTTRIDESLMTHTSARIRSWCSRIHGTRFGEDTSSSPSSRIFTLTGAPPLVLRYDSNALTWMKSCPLSSVAPRA